MPQRLTKMQIDRVSLVDKGANQRQFTILKRDAPPPSAGDMVAATYAQGLLTATPWVEAVSKRIADLIGFSKASKTEDGQDFPASDYAYVPDPDKPSTWKLRLTSSPGGAPDAGIVGAAVAALGKGFRGNKVQIPADDLPKVKAKVRAAWNKAHPDAEEGDMPEVIAKAATRTFNDYKASAELDEELPEAFQTLQNSIWGAMWAYGEDDQPLPIEQRKALVATNLDQFKEYALGLIDAGMAKRDTSGTSTAVLAIEGIVAKEGRKISAARLTRLKEAAAALTAVIAEQQADDTATEKRDNARKELDDMDPEKLEAAIAKGVEAGNAALTARIEKLEQAAAPAATPAPAAAAAAAPPAGAETPTGGEEPATLETVVDAISKLADRMEAVEKTPGQPTSIPGQDTAVKKGTGWGNVFGIGH